MSAYVVDKDLIDRLIAGAVEARIIAIASAKDWGQTLWRENVVSVAYRYSLATRDPDELSSYNRDVAAYEYEPCAVTAQQIDADIDCLDYQSCEHDGWNASAAYDLLQRLREEFPAAPRVVSPQFVRAVRIARALNGR